jgi:hypothetical protein
VSADRAALPADRLVNAVKKAIDLENHPPYVEYRPPANFSKNFWLTGRGWRERAA